MKNENEKGETQMKTETQENKREITKIGRTQGPPLQ